MLCFSFAPAAANAETCNVAHMQFRLFYPNQEEKIWMGVYMDTISNNNRYKPTLCFWFIHFSEWTRLDQNLQTDFVTWRNESDPNLNGSLFRIFVVYVIGLQLTIIFAVD